MSKPQAQDLPVRSFERAFDGKSIVTQRTSGGEFIRSSETLMRLRDYAFFRENDFKDKIVMLIFVGGAKKIQYSELRNIIFIIRVG